MMPAQDNAQPQVLCNVETEAALLGGLMIDNRAVELIAERLDAEHFYEPIHGRIYTAILREQALGRVANPITLRPYFADDEAMREVGGPSYLAQLTGSGAALIGVQSFADQIRELAMRRRLIGGLDKMMVDVRTWDADYDELVGKIEGVIAEAADTRSGTEDASAAASIRDYMRSLEDGLPPGVTSGIEELDRAIGPIREGDLIIVAGRPGMGKTALGLNYGYGAAKGDADRDPAGVLFVSREMSKPQLAARLAANICFNGHSGINFGTIERGHLTNEQFRTVYRATDEIEELPFVIHYSSGIRIGQLNRLVRRTKRRMGAKGIPLKLVIVDYLQRVSPDGRCENRTQEITQVSMGLKDCAMENGVGLMALAQLSREVEKRADKRPMMSDLRESGQIEQDGDVILFLYRAEYYLRQTEPPEDGSAERLKWEQAVEAVEHQIEFICAKRRQGETGTRRGRFFGAFQAVR